MDFLHSEDWTFPVPIYYGPGRIKELSQICKSKKLSRPLIVTDKGSAHLSFIKEIINDLNIAGLTSDIFSEISPNPIDTEIIYGKSIYENGNHDSIIAIGGGSGMDGGKAISLIANQIEKLWDFDYDKPIINNLKEFPPIICIPTTAGTGAETESTAMVTNSNTKVKFCAWHPNQKPTAAILDPNLTLSLPQNLTAWTGVDALVHAIEAYSVDSLHSPADGMALEGLRLIGNNLSTAFNKPNNVKSRGAMLIGSCLAGISFLKGLGLVHAISHTVGAVYNTQHGLTNAIILPKILQFNQKEIFHKANNIHFAMHTKEGDFNSLYSSICNLLHKLDIPDGLSKIGVGNDKIDELAIKASKDTAASTNPRSANIQELRTIIEQTIIKAR